MRSKTITHEIAMAAAKDVANRLMRKAGRSVWNADDYDAAAREYDRLLPCTESGAAA